jgi:hypothetical protein
MIDPSIFQIGHLINDLLIGNADQSNWRLNAEIIVGYRLPHAKPDDATLGCVVRYGESFLRHSAGPLQGHFWDCYGDDYLRPGLALRALMQAQPPLSGEVRDGAWHALLHEEDVAITINRFRNAFYDAFGGSIVKFEKIPNQYCPCDQCTPWFRFYTAFGSIEIGWRKRVINIDWSGTKVALPDLFADQDVTKWDHGVHAWGYAKAGQYLLRLADALKRSR